MVSQRAKVLDIYQILGDSPDRNIPRFISRSSFLLRPINVHLGYVEVLARRFARGEVKLRTIV